MLKIDRSNITLVDPTAENMARALAIAAASAAVSGGLRAFGRTTYILDDGSEGYELSISTSKPYDMRIFADFTGDEVEFEAVWEQFINWYKAHRDDEPENDATEGDVE